MDINGKTLIVTGGGQGLGRAMAIELAGAGANLALIDLNEDPLNEAVQFCKQAGGDARAYKGNVAIEEEVTSEVIKKESLVDDLSCPICFRLLYE